MLQTKSIISLLVLLESRGIACIKIFFQVLFHLYNLEILEISGSTMHLSYWYVGSKNSSNLVSLQND